MSTKVWEMKRFNWEKKKEDTWNLKMTKKINFMTWPQPAKIRPPTIIISI